jgi:hypothetical protein
MDSECSCWSSAFFCAHGLKLTYNWKVVSPFTCFFETKAHILMAYDAGELHEALSGEYGLASYGCAV